MRRDPARGCYTGSFRERPLYEITVWLQLSVLQVSDFSLININLHVPTMDCPPEPLAFATLIHDAHIDNQLKHFARIFKVFISQNTFS